MALGKIEAKLKILELVKNYVNNRDKFKNLKETDTRIKFIDRMLESLGWDVFGDKIPDEVEREEGIKGKESTKKKADYTFRINGLTRLVLEAKSLDENLEKIEYIKQAKNYAYNKACSWAILTNFLVIKIFYVDRKVDYPFSLIDLANLEDFDKNFEKLWILSKESCLNNCLDKEAKERGWKKEKISIDEQLVEDLKRWRELLSNDIRRNYAGKYEPHIIDEIVQKIIDRLIFIRKTEDSGLEEPILDQLTRRFNQNTYNELKKIFSEYKEKYDSKLFGENRNTKHEADEIEISNDVIEEVIRRTYTPQDSDVEYNFAVIDADVLGNIYEQYLAFILSQSSRKKKLEGGITHRKEQGIYYTPTQIVDFIVKYTLGEKLKNTKLNEVEKIKILDPACGSGSFLLRAFDTINDFLLDKNRDYTQTKLEYGGNFTTKVEILKENIFGVDLDTKAVEIAQLNLLLKITERSHRLPLLQKNIQCGNSLIDEETLAGNESFDWKTRFSDIMNQGGFDVIIGNPPYVTIGGKEDSRVNEKTKEYYTDKYRSYEYKTNYFILFIERCISLLRNGGYLSFIVPRTLLDNYHMKKIRKIILDSCKIKKLLELKCRIFEQAETGGNLIFILEKCENKNDRENNYVECLSINDIESGLEVLQYDIVKQSYFENSEIYQFFITNQFTIYLTKKIEKNSKKLGNLCFVNNGVNTGNVAKILLSNKKDSFKHRKILEGKDINRYSLYWNGLWINYDPSLKKHIDLKLLDTRQKKIDFSLRNEQLFKSEKIILRQTSDKLIGTYDNEEYISRHSTHLLRMKVPNVPIKYILGIFNSKLMTYYYRTLIPEKGITFAEVKAVNVKKLPIKIAESSKQEEIIFLVDNILSLNKRLVEIGSVKTDEKDRIKDEIKKVDDKIDAIVYEIYDITDEEKKIIEKSL